MSLEKLGYEEYLKYPIEIYWSSEDDCYIANVPDFDFLSAHGDTQEEALKEIKSALKQAIEIMKEKGRGLPKPSK